MPADSKENNTKHEYIHETFCWIHQFIARISKKHNPNQYGGRSKMTYLSWKAHKLKTQGEKIWKNLYSL